MLSRQFRTFNLEAFSENHTIILVSETHFTLSHPWHTRIIVVKTISISWNNFLCINGSNTKQMFASKRYLQAKITVSMSVDALNWKLMAYCGMLLYGGDTCGQSHTRKRGNDCSQKER
jgi:hypothetical protein